MFDALNSKGCKPTKQAFLVHFVVIKKATAFHFRFHVVQSAAPNYKKRGNLMHFFSLNGAFIDSMVEMKDVVNRSLHAHSIVPHTECQRQEFALFWRLQLLDQSIHWLF
jgi:hypothetical protein